MDDGGRGSRGQLILHTNSYKLEEVKDLIKVLKQKFELESWEIEKMAILIPKRELPKMRHISNTIYT